MPLTLLFSGSTPLTPLFFGLCDINAAIFPVKRRYAPVFQFNAVNAAIFPVQLL